MNATKFTPQDEVTIVYPEFVRETVRFQLHSDGTVMVRTRDVEARKLCTLSNSDDGTPWIPGHKNFNSLCRQMFREGDVDDLIAEQDRISKARGLKRKHGEDLYEALAAFERVQELWLPEVVADEHTGEAEALHALRRKMLDALAKARGES